MYGIWVSMSYLGPPGWMQEGLPRKFREPKLFKTLTFPSVEAAQAKIDEVMARPNTPKWYAKLYEIRPYPARFESEP